MAKKKIKKKSKLSKKRYFAKQVKKQIQSIEELHKSFREKYNRMICIPAAASDDLDRLPTPLNTNCHHLYIFYLKNGIRQKTNSPRCQDGYTAKGINWSTGRVQRAKAELVKLKFIEVKQAHGDKGHFGKAYIVLKYYPRKTTVETEEFIQLIEDLENEFVEWINVFTSELMKKDVRIWELEHDTVTTKTIVTGKNTVTIKTPSTVKQSTNTYSNLIVDEKNVVDSDMIEVTFFNDKISIKQEDYKYYELSIQLCEALQSKRKLFRKKVNLNKWICRFKELNEQISIEKIQDVLSWYIKHIGQEYIPEAFSAKSFLDKFIRIESAMEKKQNPEIKDKKSYKPGSEQDDFEADTEITIDKKTGKKTKTHTIDYSEEDEY